MPLDRNRLAELLNQLGDEKDETVLTAAREANALVAASGQSWSEAIATSVDAVDAPSAPAMDTGSGMAGGKSNDARLVDRLLARRDLSDTLRGDLEEFKRQLASGKLDQMDADYLRALAKRLGV
ncbi:MAG TPA: hypothetical protein VFY21_08590 [Xanthobacteraceae bacterium]|nr:hypothetical protein [Xanthobacteraceae bacterium]